MRLLSVIFVFFVIFPSAGHSLEVSPDGPKIVQLTEDSASVIVGNPAHASVVMDNPRIMMINALAPGMTRITVLGKKGNVIFNENVVVNGPSDGFIRVKNACINGSEGCQPTRIYYCEADKSCHNVHVNEPTTVGGGGSASEGDASLANAIEPPEEG